MPLTNYQPSLALNQFVPLGGVFPPHNGGSASGALLGFVRTFAGNFTPGASVLANDTLLPIAQNTALFSLYGTTFGGDGKTTFAVPGLGGRTATHAGQGPGLSEHVLGEKYGTADLDIGQAALRPTSGGTSTPMDNEEPTQSLNYVIQVYGIFQGSTTLQNIGEIFQTGTNFAPDGYMFCEGQLLQISEYEALFNLIGTTYGGDGQTTFALPDLRGRTIIGQGQSVYGQYYTGERFGTETTTLPQSTMPLNMGGSGVPFNNIQPSIALNFLIALQGIYPSNGTGTPSYDTPYLGEIIISAVDQAPPGFARCEGQLLPINQNQALFSLLGTTYGGDGRTTFALPDLRGRDVIGTDATHPLGTVIGAPYPTLTSAVIPPLNCAGDDNPNTFYGGDSDDILSGKGGSDTLTGNKGNDRLDGGTGDDTMTGGDGNDTYLVDSVGDIVNEIAGQGTDLIKSSITYTLPIANTVENLTLLGSLAIWATGNDYANLLSGNDSDNHLYGLGGDDTLRGMGGNDYLDGGSGINSMQGGAGNDTYIVNGSGDTVGEASGGVDQGGRDLVQSGVDFTLPVYVEDLILTGTAVKGTGNALNNIITGNGEHNILTGAAGNDTLDGKTGDDLMRGGSGDDTYFVDNIGDVCKEQMVAGVDDGGADTVSSTVTYTLGLFLETLLLTGSAAINATGNDGDNYLRGNGAANIITGKAGNDTLYGLGGADTFVFSHFGSDNGFDALKDFATGVDKLSFKASDFGWTAGHVLTAAELSTNGMASGGAGQFVYDPVTYVLSWDSNGAAAGGATAIVKILNAVAPAMGDFVFT